MSDPIEHSEGGSAIIRHQKREAGFEIAIGDSDSIQAITDHIEKHIGKITSVYHEIISDLVHIDVHVVAPTPERNFYTLVTSGMSDQPMTTPPQAKGAEYAELMICLPPTWKLTQEELKDPTNYWPILWLKRLARFPHEYKTWLWVGHTVPNIDPTQPFAPNTKLCCMYLAAPVFSHPEFIKLPISDEKTIYFFALFPLYNEEVEWKLKKGSDALIDKLANGRVSEVLDIARPNTCAKKFRLFNWG